MGPKNRLRLFAACKSAGSMDLGKGVTSLGEKLTGGTPARPFHPAYLFILSLMNSAFFPSNKSAATWPFPTMAALWIFPRSLVDTLGWKLIHRPSLPGLMEGLRAIRPSYCQSQKSSSSQSPRASNTPHLSLGSSLSPKPNTNGTDKP